MQVTQLAVIGRDKAGVTLRLTEENVKCQHTDCKDTNVMARVLCCVLVVRSQMLKEVVAKTLEHHGVTAGHACFSACSQRLFEISKFYLKVCA